MWIAAPAAMQRALRGFSLMAPCATRFGYLQITVRDGKGGKDRLTMLPVSLAEELRRQIEQVNLQHRKDLAAGLGEVWLPHALGVKKPGASRDFAWQYVLTHFAPLIRPAG